jgi:hypothetical protein
MLAVYRQSPAEFLLIAATAAAIIVMPIEQGVANPQAARGLLSA